MTTRDRVIRSIRATVRRAISEKKDLNKDGENDFEDVMIARMKASGMDHDDAVKKGEKSAKNSKTQSSKVTETKLTSSLLRSLLNKELFEVNQARISELQTLSTPGKSKTKSAKPDSGKEGEKVGGLDKIDPKKQAELEKILEKEPSSVSELLNLLAQLKQTGLKSAEGIGNQEVKNIWDTIKGSIKAAAGKEEKLTTSMTDKASKALAPK